MKILIIQLRRLGDILLASPLFPYLKIAFPESKIDFLTEPMGVELLETNPYLNEIVIYDKNKPLSELFRIRDKKYDVIIDLLNNPRSMLLAALSGSVERVAYKKPFRSFFYTAAIVNPHLSEYACLQKLRLIKEWLKKRGMPVPAARVVTPQLYLTKEDEKFAQDWGKAEGLLNKPYVILSPIHRHPIRQWRVEGYRELALRLIEEGFSVYLSWGPGEESKVREVCGEAASPIKLLPSTTLRKCAAIFKGSKLVVTNDSGSMHLSVSVQVPTLTIYGPTDPSHLTPPLDENGKPDFQHLALTATGVPCLGCELSECPIGHLCMKQLTGAEVFNACMRILRPSAA